MKEIFTGLMSILWWLIRAIFWLIVGLGVLIYFINLPTSDESYSAGHGDGYAAGYNTTCKIRSTLISADWDNKYYSGGYREGYDAGAVDCHAAHKK